MDSRDQGSLKPNRRAIGKGNKVDDESRAQRMMNDDREVQEIKKVTFSDYLLDAIEEKFTQRECIDFTGHKNEVNCVACSPLGVYIASGSKDNTVIVWNA